MCWTNPKTGEKTDCGRCNCSESADYQNHSTAVSTGVNPGRVYCTKCQEFLT